ncbi:MAG TPA: carbohydrate porin [Terriglobales bacterium]
MRISFATAVAGWTMIAAILASAQQSGAGSQNATRDQAPQNQTSQTSQSTSSGQSNTASQTANQSANQTNAEASFKCKNPADPRRRRGECNDQEFTLDETLARGWNELRREMQRIGITPTASYTGALQTNATGGHDQVWSYAGLLSLGFSADFEELLRAKGLSAYVGFSWGTGSYLSGSLNATIPTSGLYAPTYYLGEMYLQQKLLKQKLIILAGRIAASYGFASLPVYANYVTYGINPDPFSLGANDVTFYGPPPGIEWGAQISYLATPKLQLNGGVFNTNINSANGANHGTDFTLQEGNKGMLVIGEIDYLHNQSSSAKGKPGQITAGVLHSNNSFPHLNNPLLRSNGYTGAYVMGQQMIFRPEGIGSSRGATIWAGWTYNSHNIICPIPSFWSVGASYQGLIPPRKNDILSVAVLRADGSKFAAPENTEGMLEVNYEWIHSRYLAITPHMQYLWGLQNQKGPNAVVAGIQLGITL